MEENRKDHALLRTSSGNVVEVEFRRTAQSTSGRRGSHRTSPPLSRSMLMTTRSRMSSPTDIALCKYPSVVPHRTAQALRASASGSEDRNDLSASNSGAGNLSSGLGMMAGVLPTGKMKSIPSGKERGEIEGYDARMPIDLDEVRTRNFLRILFRDYGGSPSRFEQETGYSANMVSQIKTGKKKVGDKLARALERDHLRVPVGTLDKTSDVEPLKKAQPAAADWPFTVSRSEFESLNPKLQREIDETLTRLVLGAQAEQLLQKQRKSG